MPTSVMRYATAVTLTGALLLTLACASWTGSDPARLAGYFLLAVAASTFKVALPGLSGTASPGFAVLLASTIEFGWAETLLLAAVSGIVQCIWRAKKQPAPIQIAFSASSLAISASVAFHLAHQLDQRSCSG